MLRTVDVVIPVYNEEKALPGSIATLYSFLEGNLPYKWRILIADNGSTDGTLAVAGSLADQYENVGLVKLELKGRGRALRKAWLESGADAVSYMDVDLSTNLQAFPELIRSLDEGFDVAIGSRLLAQSKTARCLKREITSRAYNLLIRTMFMPGFRDAQCGFKAATREVVQDLVPLVKDQAWFFDTEFLLLAKRRHYRIREIPVEWLEDRDSRVRIASTAWEDIKGLVRVRFRPPF